MEIVWKVTPEQAGYVIESVGKRPLLEAKRVFDLLISQAEAQTGYKFLAEPPAPAPAPPAVS